NICTAQVLLANMAALYAMYHGPVGLRTIAERIQRLTAILVTGLADKGLQCSNAAYFDTITLAVSAEQCSQILSRAAAAGINLRVDLADSIGISLSECGSPGEIGALWQVILGDNAAGLGVSAIDGRLCEGTANNGIPDALIRTSAYLTHPWFNRYHSETEMLRY